MMAHDMLEAAIAKHEGVVRAHYESCWLDHAQCLSKLLIARGAQLVSQDDLAQLLELAAEAKADRTAEAWARSLRETNDSPERAAQLRDLAEQIGITL